MTRALVVIALIAVAPAAGAEPNKEDREKAKELAVKGNDAYDAKQYATAIDYYQRANELAPTPGLLYNIAQAYRMLGDQGCESALDYYQQYQDALDDAGKPIREGLRARIVEMKACADGAKTPGDDDPDDDDDTLIIEPPPPPPRSTRKTVGWALVAGGGAAVAVAAITGTIALGRESDLEAMCDERDICPPRLRDDITGYNQLRYTAIATGTLGAAALIAGAYLLWTDKPGEAPAEQARVLPVIDRNSIGVRCAF